MKLSTVLIVALTQLSSARLVMGQATPPNFVLIYLNDQGWNGTSVLMDPAIPGSRSDFYQTPRLEELAAQGMRFSNAYSSAPVCSPARAALQTGKSPARLQYTDVAASSDLSGARFWDLFMGKPLSPPLVPLSMPASEITIPEQLDLGAPAQYRTAFFGVWHLSIGGVVNAMDQGYDFWTGGNTGAPPTEDPKDMFGITNAAILYMQQSVTLGQPFFVMLSHYAVHLPFEARPELVTKYEGMPPGARHSDPVYAAMTEDIDNTLGMILDEITALGISNNTYVIYTSDHNAIWLLGEDENDPLFNAKGSVYEGGLRVPLIIRGPGIAANTVSDTPVIGLDLFPTITSLAGVTAPLPEDVEGADLSPLLFNGGQLPPGTDSLSRPLGPDGELFFHYPHYVNSGESPRVPASAIRDGDFKLIRIYGENGQPDTVLLFDLSQNVTENDDPLSILNLADDLPLQAAALNAKLEQWLQTTNASLPYVVSDNVQMEWDATNVGAIAGGWRSTIDIDQLQRETWILDPPPGEPLQSAGSFSFDGNDGMTRRFFHVSDPQFPDIFDADHSSSFEFQLRVNALNQDQVLFEAGDGLAGLSITLGDADADGSHNDIRFRILGDTGNHLTLTTAIDQAADPTQEFIQLVAVFSDDPLDRYAEIYINGVLRAQIDGVAGPDEINWDNFDEAGLGRVAGAGLGGNGGAGDLPFAGNGFVGEIAMFRFDNHAINATEVLNRFLARACPWDCGQPVDGEVGIVDFLSLLASWGATPGMPCDFDGNGVGISDLLEMLGRWGPCPTQIGCGDPGAGSCFEANGTPGCTQIECCQTVCTEMPACCNVAWDAACKDMANALCGMCGDPAAGDCCVANGTPGCNDSLCCRDVCVFDPVCCATAWDALCASEAVAVCGCP